MSNTNQPVWHVIGMIGDVNPLEHGGSFVAIDRSGVYDSQVWRFYEESRELVTFDIPQCHRTAWQEDLYDFPGVGANNYHPNTEEWFGSPESLSSIAQFIGQDVTELTRDLCSHHVMNRAHAYLAVCDYWGVANFDSYPCTLSPSQARRFIDKCIARLKSGRECSPSIA
jgi:hypothetical protein